MWKIALVSSNTVDKKCFLTILQSYRKDLDDNNIDLLITESDKIDGIEPEVKDELKDLDERWKALDDSSKEKATNYDNILDKWQDFREQQLTILNWVDEKDRQIAVYKDQVNLADADEVKEQIDLLKVRTFVDIVLS